LFWSYSYTLAFPYRTGLFSMHDITKVPNLATLIVFLNEVLFPEGGTIFRLVNNIEKKNLSFLIGWLSFSKSVRLKTQQCEEQRRSDLVLQINQNAPPNGDSPPSKSQTSVYHGCLLRLKVQRTVVYFCTCFFCCQHTIFSVLERGSL
jgi:hypothetical protein